MLVVIDYGMGNLRSVAKALRHVAPKQEIVVTAEPSVVRDADRVVLPGQAGVYAVVVVVPNVSGNNTVTVSQTAGGATVSSNSVTIPVK